MCLGVWSYKDDLMEITGGYTLGEEKHDLAVWKKMGKASSSGGLDDIHFHHLPSTFTLVF